jgi:hypothetical protein
MHCRGRYVCICGIIFKLDWISFILFWPFFRQITILAPTCGDIHLSMPKGVPLPHSLLSKTKQECHGKIQIEVCYRRPPLPVDKMTCTHLGVRNSRNVLGKIIGHFYYFFPELYNKIRLMTLILDIFFLVSQFSFSIAIFSFLLSCSPKSEI